MYQFKKDDNYKTTIVYRLECHNLAFKINNWPYPLTKHCTIIRSKGDSHMTIFTDDGVSHFLIRNVIDIESFIQDINRRIERRVNDLYEVGGEKYLEARKEFN